MMGLFFPLITACIQFLVRKNKYQIPIINHCKIEIEKICRNLANKYTVTHFLHFKFSPMLHCTLLLIVMAQSI